jgi:hemolysin D
MFRLNPAKKKANIGGSGPLLQRNIVDREFLPAALEIVETPPSPIAMSLVIAICSLFAGSVVWSYFGWLDIYAVAPGKVLPRGGSKVVQSLEAGRVVSIHAKNGGVVQRGDILIELDNVELASERDAQAHENEVASAEASRRRAVIASARYWDMRPIQIDFGANVGWEVRRREENVLEADLSELKSKAESLAAQYAEKAATREKLAATIAAREKVVELAKERVAIRETLDEKGVGARVQTIEALQQYQSQIQLNIGDRGELVETEAAMQSLHRKMNENITQFIADQSQRLADAEHKRDHAYDDLMKAETKLSRALLRSSIDGTVQQLVVSSVGQVVSSGQVLLTIVPKDSELEVEALVANSDIGFVKEGQPAVIKVDSFPFTRYGTLDGLVERVSRDAVDERAAMNLNDAANAAKPQSVPPAGAIKTQDLVFPTTIKLSRNSVTVGENKIDLMSGMGVVVEIKTGQRRVIDYLMSPLREVVSQAAKER